MEGPRSLPRLATSVIGIVTAALLVSSLASWVPATLLAPFVGPQRIERPEAGYAISLPLDWQHANVSDADPSDWWDEDEVADVHEHHEQVFAEGGQMLARTMSPFVHDFCILYDFSSTAARPPAWTSVVHATTETRFLEEDPDVVESEATTLDLRAGEAVRIDTRWRDGWEGSTYYLNEGTRWIQLVCGAENAPDDRWRHIAETIEFLPVEVDPSSIAAFEPGRIERPDIGYAITLPYHWESADAVELDPVEWYDAESGIDAAEWHEQCLAEGLVMKARSLLPDEPAVQWCDLADATLAAPVPPAWATLEDFEADFLDWADDPDNITLATSYRDLPVGRTLSIDSRWQNGLTVRVYVLGEGQAWFRLDCGTDATAPADRWLSIAEAFELLPAQSGGTPGTRWEGLDGTDPGPIVRGGRIEVPGRRIALEVPEGWYALDRTNPELAERMEHFDPTTRWLVRAAPDAYATEAPIHVEAIAAWTRAGAPHACYASGWPAPLLSLDDFASIAEDTYRADGVHVDSSRVQLPAGPAHRLDSSGGSDGATESTEFLLLEDGWALSLWCADEARHDDEWLSIARTLEFLSVDE